MRAIVCVMLGSACALPAQLVAHATPPGACGPDRDHCVRPATWFALERPAGPGTLSPVTPVHAQGETWVTYKGEPAGAGIVVRTELARPANVKKNDLLIVWRTNDDEPPYPSSEEEAQTSTTRWVSAVVDSVAPSAGTFTILLRPDMPLPLASARRVIERRDASRPGGG